MQIWDPFLTENDRQHLKALNVPEPFPIGVNPALLLIDNYVGAIGDAEETEEENFRNWPLSTGKMGQAAVPKVRKLLAEWRERRLPVIHVTGLPEQESGIRGWARPTRSLSSQERYDESERFKRRFDLIDGLEPESGESVIKKNSPSAFFGTPLVAALRDHNATSIVVAGQSTSGCVRASVVDARSYRYDVTVLSDCVYDRHEAAHAMNLFDMHRKYANVMPLKDFLDELNGILKDTNE